jgi:hypothetical protein
MPSLEILEGLIGTGCAVACLYYARLGALAAGPQSSATPEAPWHSALGEYARRNPFAAVFGALAFGFLASSWSMYIAPRAIALPAPRTVEKWHVITKNVPTADPEQSARIAALQTTINTDVTTIASQQTEIARLKHLIGKPAGNRMARAYERSVPAMTGNETPAAPADTKANTTANAGTGTSPTAPATNTSNSNVASGPSTQVPGPTAAPNANPPNSTSTVPH